MQPQLNDDGTFGLGIFPVNFHSLQAREFQVEGALGQFPIWTIRLVHVSEEVVFSSFFFAFLALLSVLTVPSKSAGAWAVGNSLRATL